jgi:hypothetical protein
MSAMNTTPFSLRIFVAIGDPDGLRIVDKSNWFGNTLKMRATLGVMLFSATGFCKLR